jgi:LPXTG-motif cell wall-anchored protein
MKLYLRQEAIDITAPRSTHEVLGGTYNRAVALILNASDVEVTGFPTSGLDKIYYSINGGSATAYTVPVSLITDGSYIITYWSTDLAGNTEAVKTVTYVIDTTPPSLEITNPKEGESYPSTPDIKVTTDDPDADISYELDGKPYKPGDAIPEGDHTLVVKVTDKAGNTTSKTVHFSIKPAGTTAPENLPGSTNPGKTSPPADLGTKTGDNTTTALLVATLLAAALGLLAVKKRTFKQD